MATQRKSTRSRPKAKRAARPAASRAAKASKGAAARARPAKSAAAKSRPAAKPVARSAAKPAPVLAKSGRKPKLKSVARPPAVVRPLGVLPPESISRVAHKPPRPLPLPKPVRPAAKIRKDAPADPGAQPVTAKDFQEFEQRLLDERVRVLKEMGHYETTVLKVNQRDSAGDLSGYSFHMADVGTDAMEREKAFQLASAEGRILLEINEALRRMARGEYGVCESCENPILRARLEAMPTARLCLACKEKEERVARGIS
jgi:RNA polymerase-binding protein DksA